MPEPQREQSTVHQPQTGLETHPLKLVSPALESYSSEGLCSYEMKYLVSEQTALEISKWAEANLSPDPYASPEEGFGYRTTTLYLDTLNLDVFHRTAGYRRSKFRIRRYGDSSEVYVERKTRRGDRTAKQRCNVMLEEVVHLGRSQPNKAWPAEGFRSEIERKKYVPRCLICYQRSAWMSPSPLGPIRLTMDRDIKGISTANWDVPTVQKGTSILENQVVCELKFRETMPTAFKLLLERFPLTNSSVSKYRRWMQSYVGIQPGSRS